MPRSRTRWGRAPRGRRGERRRSRARSRIPPARNAWTVPTAASANGQAGRPPVRPRADEGRNEREHVEEVNELAEIPVRLQPARLAEQEASDEVHLDEHAYDSERGEDERSPETEPLSVHGARPYDRGGRSQLRGVRNVNQPRRRDLPVPPAARRQPRRLVRVGGRGVRARAGRGQAAARVGRLQLVPLVPRDGTRVVRERRDGRAHERALRERQGRPRGAARRRRRDDGRRGRHDGLGRLADDGVHDARREAVLRGHVLPARAAARDGELPGAPTCRLRRLAGSPGRPRAAGRAHRRGAAIGCRSPSHRRSRSTRPCSRRRPERSR